MKAYFYCVSSGNKRATVLAPHQPSPPSCSSQQRDNITGTPRQVGTQALGCLAKDTKSAFYFLMYLLADLVSLCECWGARGDGRGGVKMQFVMRSELSEQRMEVIKMVCSYAGLAVGIGQNSPIEIRYRDGLLTSLSRFR